MSRERAAVWWLAPLTTVFSKVPFLLIFMFVMSFVTIMT